MVSLLSWNFGGLLETGVCFFSMRAPFWNRLRLSAV